MGPLHLSDGFPGGNSVLGRAYGLAFKKLHWDLTKGLRLVKSHCNLEGFIPTGLGGINLSGGRFCVNAVLGSAYG